MIKGIFKASLLYFIIIGLLICTVDASAGQISLRTSTTCTVLEEGVRIDVTTINTGSDPAVDVQIIAGIGHVHKTSSITPLLKPNESKTARIKLIPNLELPGIYAAVVQVDFHDLNGHPFTAVSYGTFVQQEGGTSKIFVLPGETALARLGKLNLELGNADAIDHIVDVHLIAPREIKVMEPESIITVPAKKKTAAAFHLKNLSAIAGAKYPVLAIIEYDEHGRHMTTVGELTLRIKPIRHPFVRYRSFLIIAVGILLLLTVLIEILRPKPPPNDGPAS